LNTEAAAASATHSDGATMWRDWGYSPRELGAHPLAGDSARFE